MMATNQPPKPPRVGPAPNYTSLALPATASEERWVYRHGDTEIEMWVKSKEEAIATLRQYGFNVLDPSKLGRG